MVTIRRQVLIWGFALLAVTGSFLVLIQSSRADTLGFSVDGGHGALAVSVLDESNFTAIDGANVTVTDHFPGSRQTLSDGVKVVTASKPGYTTTTLVGALAGNVTLFLKPQAGLQANAIASGTVSGWRFDPFVPFVSVEGPFPLSRGNIQGGLVLKALTVADLMHFSVQSFFSPLKDTISVWGDHQVPSNLVLPDQSLFLGAVHLDKTSYRFPLAPNHPATLLTIQGDIDQSSAISAIQGGVDIGILNKMDLTKVGVGTSSTPTGDFSEDLAATTALTPKYQVTPSAPPFAADVVVASGVDMTGDLQELVPTDIKTAASEDSPNDVRTVSLKSADGLGVGQHILAIAYANHRRVSGVLAAGDSTTPTLPQFMDTVDLSDGQPLPADLAVSAPAQGVAVAVLETPAQTDPQVNVAQWLVYALPSAGQVTVPTQVTGLQPVSGYAIRKMEFDASFGESQIDGKTALMKLQRFTNSHAVVSH